MTGMELFTIPALTAAGEATAVTLGDALLVAGVGTTIAGAAQQASAQADAADATAKSLKIQAGQERAASQLRAKEERRRSEIASSNFRAKAASSGASASDVGAIDIEGDIAAEGEYRSLMQLYGGEQSARNSLNSASMARAQGDAAMGQLPFQIGSTIADGAMSYMSKYKKPLAKKDNSWITAGHIYGGAT